MYKIRLEDDQVIIYFNIVKGKFKQKTKYKANLNEKTYSFFEGGEEVFLEWEEIEEEIKKQLEEIKKDVFDKIINNKKVISSYLNESNEKGVEKAKKHLEKNKKILKFLENYN